MATNRSTVAQMADYNPMDPCSNLTVSSSNEIVFQKSNLFDITLVVEDHGILGIPKGCRALYKDHGSPCTGHLVPELSYISIFA